MAYCTSLRHRTPFFEMLSMLSKHGYEEKQLDTHDIILSERGGRIKVFLSSQHDTGGLLDRVHRLTSERVVVVYLLANWHAYHDIQTTFLNDPHVTILPTASVQQIPALLEKYANGRASAPVSEPSTTSFDILRQCTLAPPMDETLAYLVTDLFDDLSELANACSTASTQPTDLPSPYFSANAGLTDNGSKISTLRALDERGTELMINFFRTNGPL